MRDRIAQEAGLVLTNRIKATKSTTTLCYMDSQFIHEVADRSFILQRRKVIHQAIIDILRNRRPQWYIHYAFTHGHSLFRFVFILTLLMAKYLKLFRSIDGRFYSDVILLVVQFDRIIIDPMPNTHTVVEIRETSRDGIMRTTIRATGFSQRSIKITQGAVSSRLYGRAATEHP